HKAINSSLKSQQQRAIKQGGVNAIDTADMDPREEFQDRRVSPIEEL
ncbi:hypothetical protein A2U01_0091234, partial [Trifolium medium]|nr:hypothetical protein [Trifolium medium]